MSSSPDRRAVRKAMRELSAWLDRHWDPIGVYQMDADDRPPPGEYEGYVGQLFGMLYRGAPVEDIAARLSAWETESMGFDGAGDVRMVAERLISWWETVGGGDAQPDRQI